MSFKFQDKEEEIQKASREMKPIAIVCPFCRTEITMINVDMEYHVDEAMSWTFIYKCTNCKVNGSIGVDYHITTLTPIGGDSQRIKP